MYCGGTLTSVAVVDPAKGPVASQIRDKVKSLREDDAATPRERERRFEESKRNVNALLDAGRFAEAIIAIDAAIALEPSAAHLFIARGLCLGNLQRRPEAIACFDRAIALEPTLADAWFHKADFLESLNRLDEALASYDGALTADPSHAQAACDRGHVLNRLRRPAEALQSFKRAIEIAPAHPIAWFNRAGAELATKDFTSAMASFERFLTLADPKLHAAAIGQAQKYLAELRLRSG